MYMDIWDIEIITHVAAGESGVREIRDYKRLRVRARNRTISCRCFARVRIPYLRSRTHTHTHTPIVRAHASTN